MAKNKPSNDEKPGPKQIQNRRARFDYQILDTYEAGMVLIGSEVKSLFLGKANLTDAYCVLREGELWLINLDIEPYTFATHFQHERRRERKLLLHRQELDGLRRKSIEKGLTLIPLRIFFNGRGKAKVEVGIARGKSNYDKRDQIAKDETRRDIERARTGRY